MTGAESLVRTLVDSGVELCLSNPGTSELHLVEALGSEGGMRSVLGLFEGVVAGAADGYARMAGKPACALLHLGPGLGNAVANLHNARRARVPVVAVVGDHATGHAALDAPLQSDIEAIADSVSEWVRRPDQPDDVAPVAARAVAASHGPPGCVATLILPADLAWSRAAGPAPPAEPSSAEAPSPETVDRIADVLRRNGADACLLLNGTAVSGAGLDAAGRIAATTGARVHTDTFVTRAARGAGRFGARALPYLRERETLEGVKALVTVETRAPVAFFAHPELSGELTPEGCEVLTLALPGEDGLAGLEGLVDALDAGPVEPATQPLEPPAAPTGELTPVAIAASLARLLPEDAIVMNEALTAGWPIPRALARAAPHDWLDLMGGAIGGGLPTATGAALACPDRKVVCLQADGSGMYTLQALWTQAREGCDVTTVILANRRYAILELEYRRAGLGDPTPEADALFDLGSPDLDWVALAAGMGVEAARVADAEGFTRALERGLEVPGPYLVEAVL